MAGVILQTATGAHDAALRALLRSCPMPGWMRLTYEREPSFFDALSVEGRHHDVLVARRAGRGAAVGLGVRSVKEVYLNGQKAPVGYLSGLRLIPSERRGLVLARGYRLLKRLHADGRTRLYLSAIVESNAEAMRLLTSGRAGLPLYRDLGGYVCAALGTGRAPPRRSGAWRVRACAAREMAAVLAFVHRQGRRRQFFPCYQPGDFGPNGGLLRGLCPEHVIVAHAGSELIGTLALWDQRAYRQSVLQGYAPLLTTVRGFWNAVGPRLGYPRLPAPGASLAYASLALVCIREDDPMVLRALLDEALARSRGKLDFLLAGFHERDPLRVVPAAYRHLAYRSRLFGVAWDDGEPVLAALDERVPYLEPGAL